MYIDDLRFIEAYSGVIQGDQNTVFNNFHNKLAGIINKTYSYEKKKDTGETCPPP